MNATATADVKPLIKERLRKFICMGHPLTSVPGDIDSTGQWVADRHGYAASSIETIVNIPLPGDVKTAD
jgi:hypothetical protein